METDKKTPGNYLSMDGGKDWISALPALLTLEEMMKCLQRDLDLPEAPLPCEVFDVIIASGHVALAALMVGKMHLTPSQAIDAYKKLEPALSVGPTEDEEERERNMEAFKKAFTEILEENGFDEHSLMLCKEQKESGAKIIICTQNATNSPSLHSIRSYPVRGARPADCTILQAACASIAFPDRFTPVVIGSGHKKISLISAIPDHPNPTKVLLTEAWRIYGDKENVAAIVSIGSGRRAVPDGPESTDDDLMVDKRDRITSKCEQVHEEALTRLQELFIYFRFNHNQSSGDMTNNSSINAQMTASFQEEETKKRLNDAVESMRARQPGGNLLNINVVNKNEVRLKPRPSVTPNFVGRGDILEAMRERHFGEHSNTTRMPAITVLSGLGGSGKTQIACKFADEFEAKCPNIPVYFLDASSEDSLKADLETTIRSQGSLYRLQSCEDALAWLSAKARKWCLILDNADDPSLNLFPYIPKSAHGNVIITTRNSTHTLLAPNDHHTVEGLPMADAVELVLKIAHYEATTENRLFAQAIVKELGRLPLAIAHAGGYIFVHQCLPTYLDMYRASRTEFLDSNQVLPQDYQLSVATTIEMSLDKLPNLAGDMMCVFSHLEVSSIPLQIISLSAERLFRIIDGQADEETVDEQTTQQADILMAIFCPDGEWFELDFNLSIQKCLEYSLLQINTRDDDRFFSMHVLVQTYLQYRLDSIRHHQPQQLVARLLGSAITIDYHSKHHAFNHLLVPHLRLIPVDCVREAGDHLGFGQVLREQGSVPLATEHQEWCLALRMSTLSAESHGTMLAMSSLAACYSDLGRQHDALDLEEKVLGLWTRISGDKHFITLAAMGNVANYYRALGRYQESLDLEEKVLDLRTRISGDEHPDTLVAMGNLAASYRALGRYQESFDLAEKVLELQTRISGDEHPETLGAMANLAGSYSDLGRYQESLDLGEKVLELQIRILGDEHPGTLHTMSNLTVSYSNLGRQQDALDLEEKVLELETRISGDEHPNTVRAMGNLARSYHALGRYQESFDLEEKVLELQTRISGDEHPDTLGAMANLAVSYSSLGRYQESLDLEEKVLKLQTRISGEEDPNTLRAMGNLAASYGSLGRYQESLDLEEKVLELRTRISGDEHPNTVRAMGNLAMSYRTLGRYQESSDLEEKVLKLRIRILGDEHPDTLVAMRNLAASYSDLGRYQDAVDLEGKMLELGTCILGDEHPDTLVAMVNLARSYSELGRYQEALDLEEKVLELRIRILGDEHPDTLHTMSNLAVSYSDLRRHRNALDLKEKVLRLQMRISGEEHPSTLVAMGNLASSYANLGRHNDALDLNEKLLELRIRISGDEHPKTLRVMDDLVLSYSALGKYHQALELGEKLLELQTRILGDENPLTLVARDNLAFTLQKAGMKDRAISLLHTSLHFRDKVQGVDHYDTLGVRQFLQYIMDDEVYFSCDDTSVDQFNEDAAQEDDEVYFSCDDGFIGQPNEEAA